MKISFNISAVNSNNIHFSTIHFKIQDCNKRTIGVFGKDAQVYFFKRESFVFNNYWPTLKLSFQEKIQHVIDRLSLYESGNVDKFEDINQTIDIEYLKIFFHILSLLSHHNYVVPRKIIHFNKHIGSLYLDLFRIGVVVNIVRILNNEQTEFVLKSTQSFKRSDK